MSENSKWYKEMHAHAEAVWMATAKEFSRMHTPESADALVSLRRCARKLMEKCAAYENRRGDLQS